MGAHGSRTEQPRTTGRLLTSPRSPSPSPLPISPLSDPRRDSDAAVMSSSRPTGDTPPEESAAPSAGRVAPPEELAASSAGRAAPVSGGTPARQNCPQAAAGARISSGATPTGAAKWGRPVAVTVRTSSALAEAGATKAKGSTSAATQASGATPSTPITSTGANSSNGAASAAGRARPAARPRVGLPRPRGARQHSIRRPRGAPSRRRGRQRRLARQVRLAGRPRRSHWPPLQRPLMFRCRPAGGRLLRRRRRRGLRKGRTP